jgi:hypothetical protein
MSLDSDDLPCQYDLHPLCQCGVQARQGVVPSELGYGYFCGNIVGEDDACHKHKLLLVFCMCGRHN